MKNAFNWKAVISNIGVFLIIESAFMALAAVVAFFYDEYDKKALLATTLITASCGIGAALIGRKQAREIGKREGFIIVTSVWIVFSCFGLLPFYISRAIPSVTDAFFETMSGFTTTGASVLTCIESFPHGLLFWRSLIQWLGGMGFVVLFLAILPFIGGELQLFSAEATGPIHDKIQPRIKNTARRLFGLYAVLTLIETVLLRIGGMSLFDAVCHSFATLSTGGYSTKQESIAYWNSPFIQYIIILFMLIGGTNFILLYFALVKLNFKKMFKNEEFKYYMRFVFIATVFIVAILTLQTDFSFKTIEHNFRDSLFQVSSIITSTGFVTCDYSLWPSTICFILLLLMLTGASSQSTSGGMKIVRIILLMKNAYFELRQRFHPKAVLPIYMNNHVVSEKIINSVFAFFTFYMVSIVIGVFVLLFSGMTLTESVSGAISALGNIGPALGRIGPSGSFAALPIFTKWFLAFLMLVGRLELFSVLILFSPSFWKK